MSRFAVAGLRLLGALAAGAAAWTTFWLIRGGEPGPLAYVASLAATLVVYVLAGSPAPRPWVAPDDASREEEAPPTPAAPTAE
ncbi:MAG TPA: hypothetical protein VFX49_13375 [Chloroflexota bacterium]|nr:hypothetical protein [Chloroflexota bacterium]